MADCLESGNACLVMHQATGKAGRGDRVGTGPWLRAAVGRRAGLGGRVVGDY